MNKGKIKNSKGIWIFFAVFLAIMVVLNITGVVSFGSGTRIGWVENNGANKWTASYISFSGMRERNLNTGNQPAILHVEIKTTSGKVGLEIEDKNRQILFSKDNISTSSFDIDVPGTVTAQVSGQGHRGSFSITW